MYLKNNYLVHKILKSNAELKEIKTKLNSDVPVELNETNRRKIFTCKQEKNGINYTANLTEMTISLFGFNEKIKTREIKNKDCKEILIKIMDVCTVEYIESFVKHYLEKRNGQHFNITTNCHGYNPNVLLELIEGTVKFLNSFVVDKFDAGEKKKFNIFEIK